mmetsp:Transcript_142850/g.444247  ORF Transcript_142850/g.444247 Transcript_142850/m.444247 type:complete len:208 (-) Transcript_142850:8-631(-)
MAASSFGAIRASCPRGSSTRCPWSRPPSCRRATSRRTSLSERATCSSSHSLDACGASAGPALGPGPRPEAHHVLRHSSDADLLPGADRAGCRGGHLLSLRRRRRVALALRRGPLHHRLLQGAHLRLRAPPRARLRLREPLRPRRRLRGRPRARVDSLGPQPTAASARRLVRGRRALQPAEHGGRSGHGRGRVDSVSRHTAGTCFGVQ